MANDPKPTAAPVPAAPAEKPAAAAQSQTSPGVVKLQMSRQQHFTSELQIDGYTFPRGEAVEVAPKDAERLMQRRDEKGRRYVEEAKD